LIRKKLVDAGVAVPPVVVKTQSLPVAWRGKSYTARLQAVSGRRPYSWSVAGRLPLGLHLRPSGVLWGVVRARPGRFTVTVRAKDAIGQIGTRKLLLRLR
jgi:Putative Ig domain